MPFLIVDQISRLEIADEMRQIEAHLQSCLGRRVRELRLYVDEGGLVIRGKTES